MRTLLRSLRFTAAGWKPAFIRRLLLLAPLRGGRPERGKGSRRQESLFAVAAACSLLISSCTAPYYRLHPQFDLRLATVDPPGWIGAPEGSADSTIYEFHDHRVRFQWAIGSDARLDFVLDNLSPDTLHVLWEDARYVDEHLDSHRVLHAGVRISDRSNPRPEVTVPPLGKLVDFVLPEHLIVQNPAKPGELLRESPLVSLGDGNPRQTRREAKALRGRQIQVLLPMASRGATKSYRFAFQIDRVILR